MRLTTSFGRVCCCLALASALAVPQASAQEERRGFIGLGFGPSQPLAAFAQSGSNGDIANARAGYLNSLLNVSVRRGEHWGIAGLLTYGEFVMFNVAGPEVDWWQAAFIGIGPMYTLPLSEKTALDLKGTVGLASLTPVIDELSDPGEIGSGIGIDLRATLRYDFARRWAAFTELGVQTTSFTTDGITSQRFVAPFGGFGIAYRPRWRGRAY